MRLAVIRVAQVLNRMDSGGIEAVVMNYYRHIDREHVQFDFYINRSSRFPQREELERLGAGIYLIPPYSRPISYVRALRRAFKERQYTIVHAHLNTMSVFPLFAAKLAGVAVRICHNHTTANRKEGLRTVLKYLLRPTNKLFSTHWFACGESAGRWMYGSKAFDAGRVTVMPNAIDAARFAYDDAARMRLRRELGLGEGDFVIGHVGRFMFQKNHRYLIDMFTRLCESDANARLLLIGEGELEDEIRSLVAAHGLEDRVIFTGARRDVDKLYSAMDVFVLPSQYEGFGMVAVEAQANGLPCVCSEYVPREVDVSDRCCHLPVTAEAIPEWVDSIRACMALPRHEGCTLPEKYDIRCAAVRYQEFIERENAAQALKSDSI